VLVRKLIKLSEPVADIYRDIAKLEAMYPGRKFPPDGHLEGSIGEVITEEELGLTLYGMCQQGHDAFGNMCYSIKHASKHASVGVIQ
jgi:hypothetical protein